MQTLMRISSCLSLLISAGCTTTKPAVVIEYKTVERHIPASLKRPCPKGWSKPGGPAVTADFIERGDVEAHARAVCSAQMNKIIAWDK